MEEKKKIIASMIYNALQNSDITIEEIESKIETPKDKKNGDFAYPCFNLAKVLRNSPINIANQIKENIEENENISKVEVVNGFLNFYLNSENIVNDVLKGIVEKGTEYGKSTEGNGINIIVEYSSPNIAKPFHLGHFRNTVLGNALYSLYKELGYNVTGINHLGDWGRQFGILIEGYRRFKDEYDLENNPLEALSDIYVRINKIAKEDEEVMNIARENFKKLEEGDEELTKLWAYFREVSLKEYNRIYKILGSQFDSYNGEAFYNDKMQEVVDILDKNGALIDSQGAKVVNVGDDMPPCIVLKSNGSTIYATRDLAAILYRTRTYDFTKCIYITATEQILHFKQVFEAAKHLIDAEHQKGLVHVSYGMIRLKTGKMSTREGNVIYVTELLDEAVKKAKDIIVNKNPNLENADTVANQVGVGALIFNYLKSGKNKDIIFDLDDTLRFDGETGPYVQYTYVRTKSILEKVGFNAENIDINSIDFNALKEKQEVELIKELEKFESIIRKAANDYEPSVLARYLIDVATAFSRFYNECSVANLEDENLKAARCVLVYATSIVIKKGLSLLGIDCPEKM
ncbi:MAG: arginine--tRNA ligase [Clostridia bacterium]|nr:arginine--tRNA ligase [Clostridia bacterium]